VSDARVGKAEPTLRFRRHSAITVAAIIALISGVSLGTWAPYLLPLLVIPLLVAVWAWRSGTDVDKGGVTVRAALGSRRIPWSDITGIMLDPDGRPAARLSSGRFVTLTAVSPDDLPRLVAVSGQELSRPQ
jgi:Bacterial PH domain